MKKQQNVDVVIIGAGVIGSLIAYELAKYDIDILVIEKENDVGDGTSCANSGILHSGYDPEPTTLMAKLNIKANDLFDKLCSELDVQLERIGSLTVALSEADLAYLDKLVIRAKTNNVPVQILNKEELFEKEAFVNPNALGALFAPSAGILNPFELNIAAMEVAMDNGVRLNLNEEVIGIDKVEDTFIVKTNKASYHTKNIINCAGVYADKIHNMVNKPKFSIKARRGEYYVIDNLYTPYIKHVIFGLPSKAGKGVLITPTTHYNYLIGPSSEFILDKDDVATHADILKMVKDKAAALVSHLPFSSLIREFSGLRAVSDNNDFIIEEASPHFYDVAGIQSPGLSASPAIALMVEELVLQRNKYNKKKDYNPKRRKVIRSCDLDYKMRLDLIKENKQYAHIICRCENISEAEVVDAINRNCGARTIKGVKKRTRPGAGRCQGGFCESHIIDILSRELNKAKTEIEYAHKDSFILFEKNAGAKHD